jgi:serine/threonine protein kinase
MVGLFNDTAEGLIPDKFGAFRSPYPVIVMELLEGGDMFNRISTRQSVTESFLAETFLSAMWALRSIHERGYVHRDLKLDNLMLCSPNDPSPVKIIDFG